MILRQTCDLLLGNALRPIRVRRLDGRPLQRVRRLVRLERERDRRLRLHFFCGGLDEPGRPRAALQRRALRQSIGQRRARLPRLLLKVLGTDVADRDDALGREAHAARRAVRRLLVHALVAAGPAPDALEALRLADEFSFGLESSLLLGLHDDKNGYEKMVTNHMLVPFI